ncbi:MAG: hypothetical protein HEQ32_05695 [Vampirovibrio sp.]
MSGYGNLGFSNYTAPSGMMPFASNYPSQYPKQPLPPPNNLQFISRTASNASALPVNQVNYNQRLYPSFYSSAVYTARPYGPISPPYQFNQGNAGAIKNPSTLFMLLSTLFMLFLLKNTQKAPVVEPPVLNPKPIISSGNDSSLSTPTQPPTQNFLALLKQFLQRQNTSSPSTPAPAPTPDPIVQLTWIPTPTPPPEMIAVNESAAYWGDPHVVDPDRQNKADNRATSFDITPPGEFNLLKDKDVSLTAKQDLFPQWQLAVATEVNLKLKDDALSLNGEAASLNGKALKEGEIVKLQDGTEVKWEKDQLTATNTNKTEYDFSFTLIKTGLKDKDGKLINYIDTDVKTKDKGVAADGVKPTGILGEGFDADNKERTQLNKPLDDYRVSDYKAPVKTETPAPAEAEE